MSSKNRCDWRSIVSLPFLYCITFSCISLSSREKWDIATNLQDYSLFRTLPQRVLFLILRQISLDDSTARLYAMLTDSIKGASCCNIMEDKMGRMFRTYDENNIYIYIYILFSPYIYIYIYCTTLHPENPKERDYFVDLRVYGKM